MQELFCTRLLTHLADGVEEPVHLGVRVLDVLVARVDVPNGEHKGDTDTPSCCWLPRYPSPS